METNKGYKVTDKDMQCRGFQFELGKKFRHEGKIELCESGFHFCKKLFKCFNYYVFDPTNRVFEIEHGDTIGDEDEKMVTDSIVFLRELTWAEVLDMVNMGVNNSGYSNSGDNNSGRWNIGNMNSGNNNSGNMNSGFSNVGHNNSGYHNAGHWNSGFFNSGSWNSGSYNSGYLNSERPKLRIFNKETDIPISDIKFPKWLRFGLVEWHDSVYMIEDEKEQYPNYKITGGYLKTLDFKKAAQQSYAAASKEDQDLIEQVPNYDADVLFEIFGIDRRKK